MDENVEQTSGSSEVADDVTAAREQALKDHMAAVERAEEVGVEPDRADSGQFLPKEHEHQADYDADEPGYNGEPDYTVEETNAKEQRRDPDGESL